MQLTKTCSLCKQEKPISEFSKDRYRKSGLQCHCKDCNRAYSEKYKQSAPIVNEDGKKLAQVAKKASKFLNTIPISAAAITFVFIANLAAQKDGLVLHTE